MANSDNYPSAREVVLLFALAIAVAAILYFTWGDRSPVAKEEPRSPAKKQYIAQPNK